MRELMLFADLPVAISPRVVARVFEWIVDDPVKGCWLCQLKPATGGYCRTDCGSRRNVAVHRLMYEYFKGPIPEGLDLLHSCDVRVCCNPDHLRPGNALDNSRDAVERGRVRSGERHHMAKLTVEAVELIRASALSADKLARLFGVAENTVAHARRGATWRVVSSVAVPVRRVGRGRSVLSEEQVRFIRSSDLPVMAIAVRLGVSLSTVYKCRRRMLYRAVV